MCSPSACQHVLRFKHHCGAHMPSDGCQGVHYKPFSKTFPEIFSPIISRKDSHFYFGVCEILKYSRVPRRCQNISARIYGNIIEEINGNISLSISRLILQALATRPRHRQMPQPWKPAPRAHLAHPHVPTPRARPLVTGYLARSRPRACPARRFRHPSTPLPAKYFQLII